MKCKYLKIKAYPINDIVSVKTSLLPNTNKKVNVNISAFPVNLEISSSLVCGQVIFYTPIVLEDGVLYLNNNNEISLILVKDE